MVFDLQKNWRFFARNICAWSHLNFHGTPFLFEIYLCINFFAMSAVAFVTTLAIGFFDHLSIATWTYASWCSSSGRGPAKSSCTSSFGSTTESLVLLPKLVLFFFTLFCAIYAVWKMVWWMWGIQILSQRSSIVAAPQSVRWRPSRIVRLMCCLSMIRSTNSKQSYLSKRQFRSLYQQFP